MSKTRIVCTVMAATLASVAAYAEVPRGRRFEWTTKSAAAKKLIEHLKQTDPNNPFETMLLARTYEKLGQKDEAKKAYQKVVDSQWPGIERPLVYSEAKRKLKSL